MGGFIADSLIHVGHCSCFTARIVSVRNIFYLIDLEYEAVIILINSYKYVNAEMGHLPKATSHFVQGQDL